MQKEGGWRWAERRPSAALVFLWLLGAGVASGCHTAPADDAFAVAVDGEAQDIAAGDAGASDGAGVDSETGADADSETGADADSETGADAGADAVASTDAGVACLAEASLCDDDDVCTDDSCDKSKGCVHVENTAACDDGEACTVADVCSGGKCVSGSVKDCSGADDDCNKGKCVASGTCVKEAKSGSCDDGDVCTVGDACAGGKCVSGGAKACDDGNACTADTCTPGQGCAHTAVAFGASCAGPLNGQCVAGKCQVGCAPGYEAVQIDDWGVAKIACAALGPVWGARPDKPVGVYTVSEPASGQKVVVDSQTKLMWQQATSAKEMKWAAAKLHCAQLVYGKLGDWRLPSVVELASIADYTIAPPGPTIDVGAFPGTKSKPHWYWSASALPGSSSSAWCVSFNYGHVLPKDVGIVGWVRCVRGG